MTMMFRFSLRFAVPAAFNHRQRFSERAPFFFTNPFHLIGQETHTDRIFMGKY
jgi:hypothetical protein